MKTKHVFILFCFLYGTFLKGQDSLKHVKRIRINDVGVQINVYTAAQPYTDVADFRAIVPQSTVLNSNFIGFTPVTNKGMFSEIGSTNVFSIFTSFKFTDKQKTGYRQNIRLKAGLSLYNQQLLSHYTYSYIRLYDDLYSSHTNNVIESHDLTHQNYSMVYSSYQLRLDVSFLWSTDQQKHRMAFYTGIGVSGGRSVYSTTSVYSNSGSLIENTSQMPAYTQFSTFYREDEREEFTNKPGYGFAAYIPLGLDLVLGRKSKFWSRTHIYYELKPTLNTLIVPGVRGFSNIGIIHGWGVRFTI